MINPSWYHFTYRNLIYSKSQEDYIGCFRSDFDQTTFLIAALSEIRD